MKGTERLQRIKRMIEYIGLLAKHVLLKPVARALYGRKHLWIISERGTDARDNGYFLFRYLCRQHPEQPVYYVISKASADYPRVAALGHAVQKDSLLHWLLFLAADVRISTHKNGAVPSGNWRYKAFVNARETKGRRVLLQHGVTKDDMKELYRSAAGFSLFICGAKPEYDYVLSRFGYSEAEVRYTGFARFDGLHDLEIKRQILIMPTWRDWLSPHYQGRGPEPRRMEDSLYVQKWKAVLGNGRLGELAGQYGVSFVFYPHYEMQPFLRLFEQESPQVTLADFTHYDVQQLLRESMLLITDYSSVFFDFAYMQKPVLYYQFDEAEYRAKHYAQGYFDYRRDGFGEVLTEEAALLDALEGYLKEDCRLKSEYARRIQRFFPLHDQRNCERIYHEIVRLQGGRAS
ncbi:MAG: CDP-glycerol glycerophosphotransferase family protein [Candidatus Ventricola sp.]